jgi:pimeloyl-ACP methyl ester carboxylesterase
MNRPNKTRIQTKLLDACVLPNQSSPGDRRLTGIHTGRSHAHLVLGMLAAVFLLMTVAGCTPRPQFQARFEPAECRFKPPAGEKVECGDLVVPEDRDSRTPAEIRLHVARVRSHSDTPLADPVLFLNGGPGGHTQMFLESGSLQAFRALLAERDLIFYDQRGVGQSQPALDCPELGDVLRQTSSLSWREQQAEGAEALAVCADQLRSAGHELSAYNSLASAADLEDLRRALGYESWNLLAVSYGTRLALTTMREYPQGIRSVVLDSVIPLQVDPYSESVVGLQGSLDLLFQRCQLDQACAQAYPDLAARYWRLVDQLNAEPLRTRVIDPSSGQFYDVAVDGHRLLGLAYSALYQVATIRELPRLVAELERGQLGSSLRRIMMFQLASDSYLSQGMGSVVRCREGVHDRTAGSEPTGVQTLTGVLADYHQVLAQYGAAICEALDVGAAPAIEKQPVVSAIPTLLLAGAYDPATPASWAHLAAETLSASQTVEFPGAGHALFLELACARGIVQAFFSDPDGVVDTACVDAQYLYFSQP